MGRTEIFLPLEEEQMLKQQLREAQKDRDKKKASEVTKMLVQLYINFGETFKMSDKPDPRMAEKYLLKALQIDKFHPVAHYRLAHLFYRKGKYSVALYHFDKALDGSATDAINESQEMLAHMFKVNCSIFIAKEAIKELEGLENNPFLEINNDLIERYRNEIFFTSEEELNRIFYQKITREEKVVIGESQFNALLDEDSYNELLLCKTSEGFSVKFGGKIITLEATAFYVLCILACTKEFLTNGEIVNKLFSSPLHSEVKETTIRQTINRLLERLPYLESILETTTVDRKTARRLKEKVGYCLVCSAGDSLPEIVG